MDATDMLDVLHFFFEEDIIAITTGEQSEAITSMRNSLYALYDQTYAYGSTSSKNTGGRQYVTGDYDFGSDVPFDPASQAPKPFVPPTEFNPESSMPFGGVLDAPLA
jgi:hypothetical protein